MKNYILILLCLLFFTLRIDAQEIKLEAVHTKEIGTFFHLVKDSLPADTILVTRTRSRIIDYFFENDSTLNFIYDRSGIILYSESHKKNDKWEFALLYQIGYDASKENAYDPKIKVPYGFKFKHNEKITYQLDEEMIEIEISQIREIKSNQHKKARKIYSNHLKSHINGQDE